MTEQTGLRPHACPNGHFFFGEEKTPSRPGETLRFCRLQVPQFLRSLQENNPQLLPALTQLSISIFTHL